jgi:hypothetical protein
MTPSVSLILIVFMFWTLPASAGVLMYRSDDRWLAKVQKSVGRIASEIDHRMRVKTST